MRRFEVALGAEAQWDEFAARVGVLLAASKTVGFFGDERPITGARAPGRLDVLGGVADYSGGTVLEMPIAEATFAAVQISGDETLTIRSEAARAAGLDPEVQLPLSLLFDAQAARPVDEVRRSLTAAAGSRWAAYVAGCLYLLVESGALERPPKAGLRIYLESTVPIGAGVSSSAALEVATMQAISGALRVDLEPLQLASLCQQVENRVAGAPCGIMDQVTSALGREDHLLVLKCQPHQVLGHLQIPPGWNLVGIDSGVKHSVGGGKYTRARVAAFMGLKIVQTLARDEWGGYLCNLSRDAWNPWRERVPEELTGRAFLEQYGALPDTATSVDPDQTYHVRAAAEHPILENERVREFIALAGLAGREIDEQLLTEAGALLLDAHASYSDRLDLGSPETDMIVELAMERGPERGLFGAKITGGGSGGTVAILSAGPEAPAALEEVRTEYARQTGITPLLLQGSSPGALDFGARRLHSDSSD